MKIIETLQNCYRESFSNFKASGVFVEQKLLSAKNTLAFCSRWSQKERDRR